MIQYQSTCMFLSIGIYNLMVIYTYKTEAFGYLMHIEIHILADIEKFFSRKSLEYPCEGFNQFWW